MTTFAPARRGLAYAGIAWDAAGYEIVAVDADDRVIASRRFAAGETEAMIAWLRDEGEGVVAVVDSTNGILDGRMMAAGLVVFRADPPNLPKPPLFGSAPAIDLARAARRDLRSLTRLERRRGSQTGREAELEAEIGASTAALADMTAAGLSVSHGSRDTPQVALTFDDGPLAPHTTQILDVLESYRLPATFFCVGMNAQACAAELSRMRRAGHTIGNHTWSHPFLPELSRPQLADQINRTGRAIATASGGPLPSLFRPPYGSRTPEILEWLADLVGLTVFWDVAPDDWAMPGAETIAQRVLEEARPGSIILLHDGGGDRSQTVAALSTIVEGLLERDYRFTTVDGLVAAGSLA
jgi:peptidoglycan/xylan/chitin deacetylase (PgdA/CDA1 family)